MCHPKFISTLKSPINLKTLNHEVSITQKASIPLFKELGDRSSIVDFYICKFHKDYDGLIGNNILIPLKVKIDFENEILHTNNNKTKLNFELKNNKYEYKIDTTGEKILKVPVQQKDGLAYLKEQKSLGGNVTIREGVYNVENYEIHAVIDVAKASDEIFNIEPLQTELVNERNFNVIKENVQRPISEQLRCNHLNEEEKQGLIKEVNGFSHIFYQENFNLTFTNAIKHRIRTLNDVPIHVKSYRYPYIHKEEVQRQINEMLEKGIIRHSNSPYSAPVWVVPKRMDASGKTKWRIVIDYRRLNEVTIDDKYPIPNIEEILEKLGRCQYFTTLDLAKGFHQIEIHENDIHKTAFSVENGHYEFLRMPFGLKTAPATFQRLMNNVLKEYINKICLVYLDDIIIYSTSLQEHLDSLRKIFTRLSEANLKVQLDKSEFLKRETEFLGHVVTQEGIKPNPQKIICVQNFPIPKNAKQIKQFLGLTGYYRRFIRDYSRIAKPITKYLKKDAKLDINDPEYLNSIETLKRLLTTEPILKYPDLSKTFIITTDASNYALGAILSQDDHPICFASRTLNDHEQNYSTIEKELLAIVWATKYFRPYVFGRKFYIETDHKPLQWLFSVKEPNSRLFRWKIKLSEYNYEIRYKKGRQNGNADALSRIQINHNEEENSNGNRSNENNTENRIPLTKSPLNVFKNQIIIQKTNSGSLKIKNKNAFNKQRKIIYVKDLDNDIAIVILKNHCNPNTLNALYVPDSEFFNIIESAYLRYFSRNEKFKVIRCNHILEDIEDEESLAKLIEEEHLRNNHRGITEVTKELQMKYYNPKLSIRVTQFINNCEICNLEKYERKPIKQKYQLTETPSAPNQIIHIDVFYTLEKNLFLTFIDKFSKFAQAIKINARSWTEFKRALLQYLSTTGDIGKIVVDNELGFKALPLREFLNQRNITIHYTSNNNHTSNADVERLHNTINEHLRLLRHDPNKDTDTVEEKILKIIYFYNNSIHSTTNKKPIDFHTGKIKEDDLDEIRNKILKIKTKNINNLNKTREDTEIEPGPNFIKEIRGGKNHAKFRKLEVERFNEDHVLDKVTKLKYYKSHIKRKKKFQNNKFPTIKAKIKIKRRPNRNLSFSGQDEDPSNNPNHQVSPSSSVTSNNALPEVGNSGL